MTAALLTPAQVAEVLGVSRATVFNLTKTHQLECVRVTPTTPRYREEHVEAFIRSREVERRPRRIAK